MVLKVKINKKILKLIDIFYVNDRLCFKCVLYFGLLDDNSMKLV